MDDEKKGLVSAFLVEGSLILFLNSIIFRDLPLEDRHVLLWSFLVGVMLFAAGLLFSNGDRIYNWLKDKLQRAGAWLGISPLQAFLLITSPLFTILAINAAGLWIKMRSPYAAVTTWLIGIALAVLGGWNFAEEKPRLSKATIFWFALVTLLAFLFRGLGTGAIPIVLTGDESSAGVSAIDYATGEWNNIFITSWFSFPSLFSFLQSLSLRIFGNTIEAIRIPSALAGALTVGAVYLCGRSMFGHRAGLFAALVLAALHFHIHFSRLGLNNIWDGLWFTITIGALWHGWKTRSRWAYLLAGFGLGLSQYFYASSKVLIGIIALAALLAFHFRRTEFRQAISNLCAALMVTLAVCIPLAWYYLNEPNALWAPFARVSMLEENFSSSASFWNFLSKQLPISLGAYTNTLLGFWYAPGTPLLRPFAATFFYIGLIFLLFDRDARLMLLTLWLVAFALLNALSSYIPAAQRYVAAAPACALVVGYGLHKIAETLALMWLRLPKIISVLAYLILISMMVSDLLFYFVEYTGSSYIDELNSNGTIAHQFGNYLKDQPVGTQVVFFSSPRMSHDSPAILYLAPQIHAINAPEEWESFDQSQLTSPKILFVFLPEYREDIETIQADYPGGLLRPEKAWNGSTLFWVYEYVAE